MKTKPSNPAPVVQVINQVIIPEQPVGLVGEKVVYSQKFLKSCRDGIVTVPACGYFVITKATIDRECRVMVALHPRPHERECFRDGTHAALRNLEKYIP